MSPDAGQTKARGIAAKEKSMREQLSIRQDVRYQLKRRVLDAQFPTSRL